VHHVGSCVRARTAGHHQDAAAVGVHERLEQQVNATNRHVGQEVAVAFQGRDDQDVGLAKSGRPLPVVFQAVDQHHGEAAVDQVLVYIVCLTVAVGLRVGVVGIVEQCNRRQS